MIDYISLTNFKAFRLVELELAPLTLLSGWNSAGKSSVLQSLAVLRQSMESGVLQQGLLLNGEYVELGTGRDVLHEDYAGAASAPSITIEVSEAGTAQALYEFRYEPETDLLPVVRQEVSGTPQWLGESDFQFLRADRLGPAAFYSRSYRAVELERRLGTRGEHAVNFLRIHQDDQVTPGRHDPAGGAEGALLDQVSAWLQHLSPGVNVDANSIEAADVVALSFGYHGRAGLSSTNRYRATNVGFGLSYVLPIVVAALSASEGATLLIENPEAHLHPRGQSALAQLLGLTAASGVQVLVESHSDHFLNGIRRAVKSETLSSEQVALHFFERERDGEVSIETPMVLQGGALSSWPPGFFDEWDRAITDLLT